MTKTSQRQYTYIDSRTILDMLILFSRRYTIETLEYSRIVHLLVLVTLWNLLIVQSKINQPTEKPQNIHNKSLLFCLYIYINWITLFQFFLWLLLLQYIIIIITLTFSHSEYLFHASYFVHNSMNMTMKTALEMLRLEDVLVTHRTEIIK